MDPEKPEGRMIDIAVSKLEPTGTSEGTIFTNPGGPGIEGRSMPAMLLDTNIAELADSRTLVGIDVRGTGESTSVLCDAPEPPDSDGVNEGDATTVTESFANSVALANSDCIGKDPGYFSALTTANSAHDLDQVREALGVDKVDYFGMSWGTELGAAYSSLYGEHVGRMLLDSVVDLRGNAKTSLDDIARVMAHSEANEDAVLEDSDPGAETEVLNKAPVEQEPDLKLLEEYNPAALMNATTRTGYTCTTYTDTPEPSEFARQARQRLEKFGLAADQRIAHPLVSELNDVSLCSGWTRDHAEPVSYTTAQHPLQLVAHRDEVVTPATWAQHAHDVLGGSLLTLPDSTHAGLMNSDRAQVAIDFLRDGKTAED